MKKKFFVILYALAWSTTLLQGMRTIMLQTPQPDVTCKAQVMNRVEAADLLASTVDTKTLLDRILGSNHLFFPDQGDMQELATLSENYVPVIITITNNSNESICFHPSRYTPMLQQNTLPTTSLTSFLSRLQATAKKGASNAYSATVAIGIVTIMYGFIMPYQEETSWQRARFHCDHISIPPLIRVLQVLGVSTTLFFFYLAKRLETIRQQFAKAQAHLTKQTLAPFVEAVGNSGLFLRCIEPSCSYTELLFLDKTLMQLDPNLDSSFDFVRSMEKKASLDYFIPTRPTGALPAP